MATDLDIQVSYPTIGSHPALCGAWQILSERSAWDCLCYRPSYSILLVKSSTHSEPRIPQPFVDYKVTASHTFYYELMKNLLYDTNTNRGDGDYKDLFIIAKQMTVIRPSQTTHYFFRHTTSENPYYFTLPINTMVRKPS